MIIIRPLIRVLSKIIELPKGSYLDPTTLGSGDPDGTNFLRGDGTWSAPTVDGYVPYVGATEDVDLGEWELKAGQFELDQSPTGTAGVAVTRWNNTIGSTETTLKGGSVLLKNGVDLVARVVNKVTPNITLTKAAYQAVRVSGAQGQRLAVAYAQANNDNNSADTIGLVTETIATNQEGFIITVGQLEEINTTGSLQGETWTDGDVLYLSPTTPGALTNVKPNGATGHIVVMGYVEYAHAIHGKIYVKIMNGWELDELHNVYINPATLADNDILQYDSATSLWKNEPSSSGITVGTTPVTSGTIGRVFFQGAGNVVQQSANLFWDNTNNRLGVGATPSTTVRLDVRAQGSASTDIAFRVRNSADSANLATIQGDGAVILGTYTSPNTRLSVTGTTTGIYGAGATAFFADSGGAGARIGYDSTARSSTLGALSIGVRGIADGGGASGLNRGIMGQASGLGTNYAGYFDAVNGTTNYALYIQRGWVQGATGINILSQGALSSDIAFRVRNSANTADILTVQGDAIVNAKTRMLCGTSGMTTTGGALHVYAGNSADFVSRWFNTAGVDIMNLRTSGNGAVLTLNNASGTAGITLNGIFSNALTFGAGRDIYFDTATGTKIGAATNQKLAFWNNTPIVQPTTAIAAATFVTNTSLIANDTATFDGYTIGQVVRALRNIGILA